MPLPDRIKAVPACCRQHDGGGGAILIGGIFLNVLLCGKEGLPPLRKPRIRPQRLLNRLPDRKADKKRGYLER